MRKLANNKGQMTVEFSVVLPVLLIIALVLVNVLSFVSETAKFDRCARNAIRTFVTSQGRGQEISDIRAYVTKALMSEFDKNNEDVECSSVEADFGLKRLYCKLSWQPTLFGLGLKDEILGIATPKLTHEVELVVDKYKLLGAIG